MSLAEITKELEHLPAHDRADAVRQLLESLYPGSDKTADRWLRRLENPDVPEDFWDGVEEAEDGKLIEMKDEHFDQPPL